MKTEQFGEQYYISPDMQQNMIETQAAISEIKGAIEETHRDLEKLAGELESETSAQRKLMELDAVFISMRDDVTDLKEKTSTGIPVTDEKPRQKEVNSIKARIAEGGELIAQLEDLKILKQEQLDALKGMEAKVEKWIGKWPKNEA